MLGGGVGDVARDACRPTWVTRPSDASMAVTWLQWPFGCTRRPMGAQPKTNGQLSPLVRQLQLALLAS